MSFHNMFLWRTGDSFYAELQIIILTLNRPLSEAIYSYVDRKENRTSTKQLI